MPFKKGHKKVGGRKEGSTNKKTAQWEAFAEYCLNGGLERFERELNTLEGKDYVNSFLSLLEYHKPKLGRTEVKHEVEKDTVKQLIFTSAKEDKG